MSYLSGIGRNRLRHASELTLGNQWDRRFRLPRLRSSCRIVMWTGDSGIWRGNSRLPPPRASHHG
jgi:hypothetical protein